ncbi:GGDEF domain-containing protein [Sulfurihydrogenibium sp.]|uniref:GGDEF domain-containing protein n=1 Tax=Sulfurihydrogenibium sp. TaxID=2053621 RepID=UPI002637D319|nr:GGDEF domain-containing protein [Sulfurihydrogenibium sp.]
MREKIKITLLKNLLEEVTKKYDYFISQRERVLEETYKMSITDELTQLYNRHYALEQLKREVERVKREENPFTLVMFDLDNFKPINDKYGHIKGDEVLKNVGNILKKSFRSYDLVARLGGDEFIAIIFEKEKSDVEKRLQKIREEIENIIPQENLSVSYGILQIPDDIKDILEKLEEDSDSIIKEILNKVDFIMYTNKKKRKGML